jgi:hypothetical protein
MMTNEQLDEIEARANAATPGPWEVLNKWWVIPHGKSEWDGEICGNVYQDGDSDFIAAARSDVPALVAEVRRLREYVDAFSAENEFQSVRLRYALKGIARADGTGIDAAEFVRTLQQMAADAYQDGIAADYSRRVALGGSAMRDYLDAKISAGKMGERLMFPRALSEMLASQVVNRIYDLVRFCEIQESSQADRVLSEIYRLFPIVAPECKND